MLFSWSPWTNQRYLPRQIASLVVCYFALMAIYFFYFRSEPQESQWHNLAPHAPQVNSTASRPPYIALVTALYGKSKPVYERAVQIQHAYAVRHDYGFWASRREIMEGIWTKPADVLELILNELEKTPSERLRWVFWIDSDVLIANPLIPLETFLPPAPDFQHVHLVAAKDVNGLNAGVFFIEVHPWAVEFLGALLGFRATRPKDHLEWLEQSAMESLLKENYFNLHAVVDTPQHWFNAFPLGKDAPSDFHFKPGDLNIHFAGKGGREANMTRFMDKLDMHLDEFEVPLHNTNLTQELEAFWAPKREELKHKQAEVKLQIEELRKIQKTAKTLQKSLATVGPDWEKRRPIDSWLADLERHLRRESANIDSEGAAFLAETVPQTVKDSMQNT